MRTCVLVFSIDQSAAIAVFEANNETLIVRQSYSPECHSPLSSFPILPGNEWSRASNKRLCRAEVEVGTTGS